MATENLKLGTNTRIKIGKTADATADTDFVLVENENEITCTWSSDPQQIITKSAGKITTPGVESWEIKFNTNEALTDNARALLKAAKNKSWAYKVYDGDDVWLSGKFLLSQAETKAGAVSVREGSYTLQNSGVVTESDLD